MGSYLTKLSFHKIKPDEGIWIDPDDFTASEPPNYGFKAPRKERVTALTPEEWRAMKIPDDKRNYCADDYVKYRMCYLDNFPWVSRCSHEKHTWVFCEWEDFESRAKEYERERRLRERRKRLEVQNG